VAGVGVAGVGVAGVGVAGVGVPGVGVAGVGVAGVGVAGVGVAGVGVAGVGVAGVGVAGVGVAGVGVAGVGVAGVGVAGVGVAGVGVAGVGVSGVGVAGVGVAGVGVAGVGVGPAQALPAQTEAIPSTMNIVKIFDRIFCSLLVICPSSPLPSRKEAGVHSSVSGVLNAATYSEKRREPSIWGPSVELLNKKSGSSPTRNCTTQLPNCFRRSLSSVVRRAVLDRLGVPNAHCTRWTGVDCKEKLPVVEWPGREMRKMPLFVAMARVWPDPAGTRRLS
jgi:hypothetical protein